MGLPTGQYSKNIYDPFKRYWGALLQESKPTERIPWVDADFNDHSRNMIENTRRFRHEVFEDGTPGAMHFLIDESGVSNVNNLEINGGDATIEGAGRYYLGGMTAIMPSVYEFDADDSTSPVAQMDFLHHRITGLTDTVLTDVDANYTVNELVGRDLIPKVDEGAPVTRFAIISNTATTITTAGGMFAVASAADFYMVALSTPGAAPATRVDTVYLDVYLDEENAVEDPDLLHALVGVTGGVEACRRLKLVQQIHVYEGGTYAAPMLEYTALSGNYHYRVPIAQIDRLALDNTVTNAMITDLRPNWTGYGSSHEVINARDSAVYATVYETLDDRLEFAEDDALDAHLFVDECRSDGTVSGGVVGGLGGANLTYTAWVGYVGAERISIAGGAVAIGAFGNNTYYISVDSAGTVNTGAAIPPGEALLALFDVNAGLVAQIRDWRFWLNTLDTHNEVIVSASTGEGNISGLQAAINYAIARGRGVIRVRPGTYTPAVAITIQDLVTIAATYTAEDLEIIFEPGAVIEPAGDFAALTLTNTERVAVRGLDVLGTNLTNVTPMISIGGCTDTIFTETVIDGNSTAGDGFTIAACTRLRIDGLVAENLLETGIEHTGGTTTDLHIDHANIKALVDGITFGAGVVTSSSIRNTSVDGYAGFGIEIIAADSNIFIERVSVTGQTCVAVISSLGDGIHISNVDITNSSCSTAGIVFGSSSLNSSLKDSYLFDITTGPAVLLDTAQSTVVADVYINENGAAEYPISIDNSTYCTLQDVTVINALAAGIRVLTSSYCTISNCRVENTLRYAVHAEDSPYLKVVDCNLVDVVAGGGNSTYVHLEGCSYSRIAHNGITHLIAGTAYGVQTLDFGGAENVGVGIVDNVIYLGGGDYGIYLGGAGAVDEQCTVTGNEINFSALGSTGIFIDDLIESVISGNVINSAATGISTFGNTYGGAEDLSISNNVIKSCTTGINITGLLAVDVSVNGNVVRDSTIFGITGAITGGPLSIINNTLESSGNDAILFTAGTAIHVENNIILNAGARAIQLDNSDRSTIVGNGITSSGSDGIYLNNCDDCDVTGNRSNQNGGHGINLNGGDNNVLTGNKCQNNTGEGINLNTCIKCTVTGNGCSENNSGIVATATTTCVLSGNSCNDNDIHGIHYDGDYGSITGNVCAVNGTLAGQYGIYIIGGAVYNACSGNQATNSGDVTAPGAGYDIYNNGANNGIGVAQANNCASFNTGIAASIFDV